MVCIAISTHLSILLLAKRITKSSALAFESDAVMERRRDKTARCSSMRTLRYLSVRMTWNDREAGLSEMVSRLNPFFVIGVI